MGKVQPSGYASLDKNKFYEQIGFIDTGNSLLNWAISGRCNGGYPKGKVIEIFGDPSTGKSFLGLIALKNIQKEGGFAVLDDVEYAFSPSLATMLGVELENNFLVGNTTSIEEFYDNVIKLIDKLQGDKVENALFVLDSIAQLSTKHEEEAPVETRDMTKAYFTRKILRMLQPKLAISNYTLIALNHLVSNIGNMFVPKTATGGSGLKFSSTVRVELSYAGKFPPEKNAITKGVFSKFYVSKNRIAPPFRSGTIYIDFNSGIHRYSGVLDAIIDYGIGICPKGSRKITIYGVEFSKSRFEENFTIIAEELFTKIPEIKEKCKEFNPDSVLEVMLNSVVQGDKLNNIKDSEAIDD